MASKFSDEQLRRMNENRLRALRIREEKLKIEERRLLTKIAEGGATAHNETPLVQETNVVTCVMFSRTRFYLDGVDDKHLGELCRNIPSKLYDVQLKRWTLNLKDYDKLIWNLNVIPLPPNFSFAPLPWFIRQVFASAPSSGDIPNHDLSSRLDPVLLKALLPFQREGVNFAIQLGGKVLIADDVGLGKTIQAIAIASYYSEDWPLLVVTPSSVRYTWLQSFRTWVPSLSEQDIIVASSCNDRVSGKKVVLMSYDLLTKLVTLRLDSKFKAVIFDESHFLKNCMTDRTRAAYAASKDADRVIMLSGTPLLSRPIELHSQVWALRRDFFSCQEYRTRYCDARQRPHLEELQLVLKETVMIRRLKTDVLQQLPSKVRQQVVLDPSSTEHFEQRNNPRWTKEELLSYFHETGKAKLTAVAEFVIDLLEAGKKFLFFAHHQDVINGICTAIGSKDTEYIRIDGSVSSEECKNLCDAFQTKDSCRVAVLSITSANRGLTLTAADLVVFGELFWNPGVLTQAEDRARRTGQNDVVFVQYLVARGTADDLIWPEIQSKLDILNRAGLSEDDMDTLDVNRNRLPSDVKRIKVD